MPEQLANDYSTPQTEAQTTPPLLPRGDASYFTQEMANVNAAITEMRLQIQHSESNLSAKIDRALDTFAKAHTAIDAGSKLVSVELKGELKAIDASIKYLNTSVAEIKPKVDNLTKWGWIVVGCFTTVGALIGFVAVLLKLGIKTPL
jgi:DNA-binding protein YbaB